MAEAPLALLLEYLDANLQPTFVVQLSHLDRKSSGSERGFIFAHANPALLGLESLHIEIVKQLHHSSDASRLVNLGRPSRKNPASHTASFCGIDWVVTIVGNKWLIAVATDLRDSPNDGGHARTSQALPLTTYPTKANIHDLKGTDASDISVHETGQRRLLGAVKPNGHLGDVQYLEWMRQYDWASSPVGPVDGWPKELRNMCEFALATSDPINIFWGDECTLLYNHAYSIIVGDKHPRAMGRPFKENFEQWPEYYQLFHRMKETGQSVQQEKMRRMLVRDGFLEEDFFDFLMVPILAADGAVVGFTTRIHEATQQVIFERRMQILTDTNKAISTTYTVQDLYAAATDVLDKHTSDIHFAAIYITDLQEHTLNLTLEATAGMNKKFLGLSHTDNLQGPQFGLRHALQDACRSHEPKILSTSDGSLSQSTLSQLKEQGVEPCREVVVHPLKCFVEDNIAAVIIVGTSPLRKFDEDYRSFLKLLTRQIENGITVVRGIVREREMHKKQLSSELERRLWRFAENAPVGMYMYNAEDVLTFCNTAFEDICGTPRQKLTEPMAWMEMIHPDGVADMTAMWESYTQSRRDEAITFEVQFKKPWISKGDGAEVILDRTYALGILQSEYSDEGKLKGTLGCITDISSVKWAEKVQSARLSEAIEQKRQQENFLDVISHEMRNPLNAIFQCAYELAENIKSKLKNSDPSQEQAETLHESLDLATTITYCANHQKRIVDDVLTLSKLDARLLQIYPEPTNPIKLYKEILGLFAPEIRASGMNTNFMVGEGYNRLDVKHVMIDPNRVTQIVINLLSNAIKFTKKGKKRDLEMTLNAHIEEPANRPMGTRYVLSGDQHQDPTSLSEWGHKEILYLSFSVKDSGLGMTPEEASNLFQKFSQASPRTHTQFGGSGLGLYISRNLAELHGGRIGLSSQAGFGSTFEFYVKVRRSEIQEVPAMLTDDPSSGDELRHMVITSPVMQQVQPVQLSERSSSEAQTPPSSSQKNILVVEDNLINQRLLCKLITKQGYDTTAANNGEEALAIMASSTWNPVHRKANSDIVPTIDIVLCDIEMPIMDGKACVRRVRQLQHEGLLTRNIPMIAITGNARLEQVEEMRQCGFNDVVTKPYKINELLGVIKRYVEQCDDPSPTAVS
ncbi:hsp90-like protein [Stagonosporopsis vannaccii]|nr:hsp90-like protein [Stagonosporopsis vannaccii]